jgi:hypothetical protein
VRARVEGCLEDCEGEVGDARPGVRGIEVEDMCHIGPKRIGWCFPPPDGLEMGEHTKMQSLLGFDAGSSLSIFNAVALCWF